MLLTTDGVTPLDPLSPSAKEATLGPAGAAYGLSGITVGVDGSCKSDGAMGAAMVPMGNRIQARSVAVFGSASSIRPELTAITIALEDCPEEEDLNILTDSLSSMRLLKSLQRRDFPL
jgi:ribonuclease HI